MTAEIAIIDLLPHDPLPDGPALVLLRRFEEDDPRQVMIELVALDAHHTESNARLTDEQGRPPSWEEATQRAQAMAAEAKFPALHRIDRTAGPREQEIAAHGGDHSPTWRTCRTPTWRMARPAPTCATATRTRRPAVFNDVLQERSMTICPPIPGQSE